MAKGYKIPISVKGVVLEKDGVWLRKNEREEWELPGGKLNSGEQPQETVVRELLEELGFLTKVRKLIDAHVYQIPNSLDESKGVLILSYLCDIERKSGSFELIGEAGKAEFRIMPIKKLGELNMPDFYRRVVSKSLK